MMAMMIWGHVLTNKGKLVRFFFPLLLVYILLLPLYIIVGFLYAILSLVNGSKNIVCNYMRIFLSSPIIFISLKGTLINIENEESKVKIKIV